MDRSISNWLLKNNITSINLKKGNESVFATDGDTAEDIAEQLSDIFDGLPTGHYKLLGRSNNATNWQNAQTYILEKKGSNSYQNGIGMGLHSQPMYTQEQLDDKIKLAKQEFQYEELSRRLDKLETKVDKIVEAVRQLLDDDESNDKSGLEKLTELAATGKELLSDFKF